VRGAAPACRPAPRHFRWPSISLTRSGVAKASRNGKSVEAIRLRSSVNGYAGIRLQPCSIPAPTNKLQPASLSGEASSYLPYHRALPRLSSVTESIALPPRSKGGRYVQYLQIQCSRVARTARNAAGLFCAANCRCDAHSVVVHLDGPAQSAQASTSFAPTKRTRPSLAKELDARAVATLDEARGMPPGDQRTEAMNKAMILRNAAEMHEHFFSKSGAPAQ
jgi:hypothetical protein